MEQTDPKQQLNRLRRLLKLEADAEKEQLLSRLHHQTGPQAEKSGLALVKLIIEEEKTAVGGLVVLTLRKKGQKELPWHNLGHGRPVLLTAESDTKSTEEPMTWRGVISRTHRQYIRVAVPRWAETGDSQGSFRLDLAQDEVAQRRMREALDRAEEANNNRLANLREILLGRDNPRFKEHAPNLTPFNPHLNESQIGAIQHVMQAEDIAIIHGPPGTGKTTTLIELMKQVTTKGEKVLACAPSHTAVDNMLERLVAQNVNVVRLGNPIRVDEKLWPYTLDGQLANHPNIKLARKYNQQARELFHKVDRYTRSKPAPGEKRGYRQEAKALLAEARQLEQRAIGQIIDQADVVCSTITGLSFHTLGERMFSWCLIDEAGQADEPSTWIPLRWAQRVVLAGDHNQLPPTVISTEAQRQGLGKSMMERVVGIDYGQQISHLLTVQYRMHHTIMTFSSDQFYGGKLSADPAVQTHLLSDIPTITADELTERPLHYIDTAGASYDETEEEDSSSRFNPQEGDLLIKKLNQLLDRGVSPEQIGVITPYSAQTRYLREQITHEGVEISTVDGFQGREKDAILISLVRSNPDGTIGFLADTRRINVALTRARRFLLIIGDSATISSHGFYQEFISYCEQNDAYKSVWEELY